MSSKPESSKFITLESGEITVERPKIDDRIKELKKENKGLQSDINLSTFSSNLSENQSFTSDPNYYRRCLKTNKEELIKLTELQKKGEFFVPLTDDQRRDLNYHLNQIEIVNVRRKSEEQKEEIDKLREEVKFLIKSMVPVSKERESDFIEVQLPNEQKLI